ncbi:D-alanine--D-alanine ligase [Streptomyces noursei]|uniref:D-alanine--D-alanine ligase family protein n=1 Tax=Streptomyces noursei TaxID=1971 RepID=UPI001672D3C6|nr:D-alanine--D-alanine ligase [Streptomyces noursei]MCZ1020674.1 hypothetical protein [Streptomyces noursei]GGX37892.1 D-alanine--D-alanine ligase [Streptomyces noursei]
MSHARLVVGLTYNLRGESMETFGAGPPEEGDDAEFDEWATVQTVAAVLEELGHRCVVIGSLPALMARLLRGERWDLVFNLAEGHHGYAREAQIPALLEEWRIPATFSDPLCLSVCLHKPTTQRLLRQAGVATAPFTVVRRPDDLDAVDLPYPLFAKPVAEGTSKGIGIDSRVTDPRQLQLVCAKLWERHGQPVMVERYLPGPEYTVGVLGAGADARPIGVSQPLFDEPTEPFLTALRKHDAPQKPVPARLLDDTSASRRIAALAVQAWHALGCRDAGRVDLRCDAAGEPYVLDVNPLPGLSPTYSLLPLQWESAGGTYPQLIAHIMASAEQRLPAETAPAIATAPGGTGVRSGRAGWR